MAGLMARTSQACGLGGGQGLEHSSQPRARPNPRLWSRMPVAFVLVSESCFADCLTQWHVCQRPCWGSKSLQPTGGWFPSSQG